MMRKSLLWLGLVALWLPSYGQAPLAELHNKPDNPYQHSGTSLVHVLQTLEEEYQMQFSYDQELLQNKTVATEAFSKQEDLEAVLTRLLKPLRLTYEQFDDKTYVIYPEAVQKPLPKVKKQSLESVGQSSALPRTTTPTTEPTQRAVEKTITGQVTDLSTGETLPGVNILVKGTSIGTITDVEGNYRLTAPDDAETLVFSSVGYTSEEVAIDNRTTINLDMAPDIQSLGEVVVVGYGTREQKDLTGSIGSLSSETIEDLPLARPDQALVGRVAGVLARQTSGAPGAAPKINIRGFNSISQSNDPLYVVDGLPTGDINMLSANDIARMDVLKDASSAAIYGSRASNGVILITTKQGVAGKPKVELNAYTGVQSAVDRVEMMNAREIAQFQVDARRNNTLDRGGDVSGDPLSWVSSPDQIVLDVLDGTNTTDTDWLDEILEENQPIQNVHLGVRGGTENTIYYVSGEYFRQEGIVLGSNFERYSARINLNSTLSDRFNLGVNLNPSFVEEDIRRASGRGGNDPASMLGNAQVAQPFYPVRDENNEFQPLFGQPAAVFNTNPVAWGTLFRNNERRVRLLGNVFGELEIVEGLKGRVMLGTDLVNTNFDIFRPQNQAFGEGVPFGESGYNQDINWLTEYTLSYSKTFNGKHHIDGLVGYTVQKQEFQSNFLNSDDYVNNFVQTLNAANLIDDGASFTTETSLLSYLGRVNYSYEDKYYATASFRRDGSSRFGQNNKWGNFPSFALAWRVSEESWLNSINVLDNLKLRASVGFSGNNNIPDYAFLSTVGFNSYVVNNQAVAGYAPNKIPNPNLAWEQQREFNFGIDLGLLAGRINLVSDYFIKNNKDLLLNVQIPSVTGFTNQLENIGEVENKGWELTLNTVNLAGEFTWSTNFNFSVYRNEVKALGPEGDDILSTARGENEFAHVTRIGEPVGMFYGYIDEGVITTTEELAEAPLFGEGTGAETRLGDLRFRDVSGPDGVPDGIIDENDRTIIGNPHPDFTYGMTNTFSFKGINLSIALYGVQGNDILFGQRALIGNTRGRRNQLAIFNNYFRSEAEPGDGKIPRPNHSPTGNNRGRWSTFQLEDGSFLRISNITLGYTLPTGLVEQINLDRLRVYATVSNPFTFTNYNGFNPDVDDSGSNDALSPGEDWNSYPLARIITFGINIAF